MGRLASICARNLLNGKKIIVLNCEKINISGKHIKNKFKYFSMFKKKTNTNPKKGPFHFKSPSQIFWKVIRGMLPHKTKRGSIALFNLKVYEGIPPSYTKAKKFIIPKALRITRLMPGRNFSKLGNISNEIGWKKKSFIDHVDDVKKIKNKIYNISKTVRIKKKIIKYSENNF
jgi:large subunit ribosomal protein L13Ae